MPGRQRFSPPSTCSSMQISNRFCRRHEDARDNQAPLDAGPAVPRFATSFTGEFAKDRSLSAYPLLVGLELPAGEFVAPALDLPGAGRFADHLSAGLHPGGLGRALQQALALRRPVRAKIGEAGFVAN